MKRLFALASVLAALAWSAQAAETSVKLSNVHLCCPSCVKGVDKALSTVPGATAKSDKDAGTVTITAPDVTTAQKAVDSIVTAGYFGTSSDPAIKVKDKSGAKKGKIQSLKVTGVHLCCGKCVTAVNDALSKVQGVKANTAAKGVDSFEVTGDFKAKPVFAALNKAGFSGKAAN
jgi:periplasmic mercuric ion binding protein